VKETETAETEQLMATGIVRFAVQDHHLIKQQN